jgi:hypothetical protein
MIGQEDFEDAILNNDIEKINSLLKITSSTFVYGEFITACEDKNIELALLLWKDKRIKKLLQNDNTELYNSLIQIDIKNKIELF